MYRNCFIGQAGVTLLDSFVNILMFAKGMFHSSRMAERGTSQLLQLVHVAVKKALKSFISAVIHQNFMKVLILCGEYFGVLARKMELILLFQRSLKLGKQLNGRRRGDVRRCFSCAISFDSRAYLIQLQNILLGDFVDRKSVV